MPSVPSRNATPIRFMSPPRWRRSTSIGAGFFFSSSKKRTAIVSGTLIERCGVVYPRGVGRRHGRIGVVLLLALTLDGCTARRPRKVALLGYRSTSGGVPELDRRLGVRLRFEGDS